MPIMVYCHRTDKRVRNILTLVPNRKYNPFDIAVARKRLKVGRGYRYFPSEEYLNFSKKFKNEHTKTAY